jgi:hypothetical protein
MGRRVFFSFHHLADSWRVGQVRNAWLTKGEANGFVDAAEWEKVEQKGEVAIKRWIDHQLVGTSVTVVLIGTHTTTRPYVRYEIEQSIIKGNGLVGIYIHGLKNQHQQESERGPNPLEEFEVENTDFILNLLIPRCSAAWRYHTYYWFDDNGRENLNDWIEQAARAAGR